MVLSMSSDIIATIRALATGLPQVPVFVKRYHQHMYEEEAVPQASEVERAGVKLSTIHGSKGDEYRAVVIFHAAEHTIPHRRMISTGNLADIEEERRVFYVGITRAIERLFITTDAACPSRFLTELDQPYTKKQSGWSTIIRDALPLDGIKHIFKRFRY
jgi:DNA helicase-2/ATP-dependent DNA helicase PcrA